MTPAEQTEAFCSALLDDLSERAGLTSTVWTNSPARKTTRWLTADPSAVASAAREANAEPGANVYLSMGVARVRLESHRRMTIDNVVGITCVWVEIDVAGPAHAAGNLPTSLTEARRVIDSTGLAPSIVVSSGHGLQAMWLLDEPWIFSDSTNEDFQRQEARNLLRDWRASIAVHAHAMGRWKVDAVHDLSRVLRVPGTMNRKVMEVKNDEGEVIGTQTLPETECTLVECEPTRRYSIDDLRAAMVDRSQLDAFAGMTAKGMSKAKDMDLMAAWTLANSYAPHYQPEWLTDVLREAPRGFRKIWDEGHPNGDSETDMSIARRMAELKADEADAIEAIMCYRLRTGRKLEKVDPNRREDYIRDTVDKAFTAARLRRREVDRLKAEAAAALERQRASRTPPPIDPAPRIDPRVDSRPAAVAAHLLDHTTDVIVPDRPPVEDIPSGDVEDDIPEDDIPEDDIPGPADAVPTPAPHDDVPDDGIIVETPVMVLPNGPKPVVNDREARAREAEGPDSDGTGESLIPPHNPWGSRTEFQAQELDALSEMLFGAQDPDGNAQPKIWRLFQRGRGATATRSIQIRLPEGYAFIGIPPIGYKAGHPLNSGQWPSATFDGVAGWIRVIRGDLNLRNRPVAAQAFNARFGDTLVGLWEPDESTGSLAVVVHSALVQYLVDHPPTRDMAEAYSVGTPLLQQGRPYWSMESTFTVQVRWSEVCRYVRAHHAINVTPAVSAEMLDISKTLPVATPEQDGKWYRVDPDFLSGAQWQAVLRAGRVAEESRDDRRRLRVVPGGRGGAQ